MRTRFALCVLLLLVGVICPAAHVQFDLQNCVSIPVASKDVVIVPKSTPTTSGDAIVISTTRTITTDTSGTARASNIVAGLYTVTVSGTSFNILVPSTNVLVLASSIMTNQASTNSQSYTTGASDLRYIQRTNGAGYELTVSNATFMGTLVGIVSSATATNIAAYQALLATNAQWSNTVTMSNSIYAQIPSTNGFWGSTLTNGLATTNYVRSATNGFVGLVDITNVHNALPQGGALLVASNLSDLASVPTARTNLGLGETNWPRFAGLTISNDLQRFAFTGGSSDSNEVSRIGFEEDLTHKTLLDPTIVASNVVLLAPLRLDSGPQVQTLTWMRAADGTTTNNFFHYTDHVPTNWLWLYAGTNKYEFTGTVGDDYTPASIARLTGATNAFASGPLANGTNSVKLYAESLTNGLASTNFVQSATNGFVGSGITNQVATTNYTATLASNRVQVAAGSNITVTASAAAGVQTYTIGQTNSPQLAGVLSTLNVTTPPTNFVWDISISEQVIYLTNNLNIVHTTNRASAGSFRYAGLVIEGMGANYTLAFPSSWKWLGTTNNPPTSISNRVARLSIMNYGSDPTNVIAGYAVQP